MVNLLKANSVVRSNEV